MKNDLINIDPEIMNGTPVFAGTRVPKNGKVMKLMVEH